MRQHFLKDIGRANINTPHSVRPVDNYIYPFHGETLFQRNYILRLRNISDEKRVRDNRSVLINPFGFHCSSEYFLYIYTSFL